MLLLRKPVSVFAAQQPDTVPASTAMAPKATASTATAPTAIAPTATAQLRPQQSGPQPLDLQNLSVLTVLSTAAAQQEDLHDCLAAFSESEPAKTHHLHMACKDAVSVIKSHYPSHFHTTTGCLKAATAVAKAVQAALRSGRASSCHTHVLLGEDVPPSVRCETDCFLQELFETTGPADFWESVVDDVTAIKATTRVVLVEYATGKIAPVSQGTKQESLVFDKAATNKVVAR